MDFSKMSKIDYPYITSAQNKQMLDCNACNILVLCGNNKDRNRQWISHYNNDEHLNNVEKMK